MESLIDVGYGLTLPMHTTFEERKAVVLKLLDLGLSETDLLNAMEQTAKATVLDTLEDARQAHIDNDELAGMF
ncbi:MAG: hypothetical protein NXH70_02385 [Hyphomonas sp.]|nr:hypothetical protein [Hyphomonas sp.]